MTTSAGQVPQAFREILASLKGARPRGDVTLTETPAPNRMAPFALAVDGELSAEGFAGASGRFVVLHDPAGQEAWDGVTRVVALVKASLDPEAGADDLWGQVAWSWIEDALASTPHHNLGATVTRVTNESFGSLAAREGEVSVEIRVSWTPEGTDLAGHLAAWTNVLAACGGVPPLPEGVTMLPGASV